MHVTSRIDKHVFFFHIINPANDVIYAINGFIYDDFRKPSFKTATIIQVPQWAVQTRRRYFKRVRVTKCKVRVEDCTQIPTDTLTIAKRD